MKVADSIPENCGTIQGTAPEALFSDCRPGELVIFKDGLGVGKSVVAIDLAAEASASACAGVLIAYQWDDPETTICPRLEAAQAIMSNVLLVRAGEPPGVTIDSLNVFKKAHREAERLALIILDTINLTIEAESDAEVLRLQIDGLLAWAAEKGVSILAVLPGDLEPAACEVLTDVATVVYSFERIARGPKEVIMTRTKGPGPEHPGFRYRIRGGAAPTIEWMPPIGRQGAAGKAVMTKAGKKST